MFLPQCRLFTLHDKGLICFLRSFLSLCKTGCVCLVHWLEILCKVVKSSLNSLECILTPSYTQFFLYFNFQVRKAICNCGLQTGRYECTFVRIMNRHIFYRNIFRCHIAYYFVKILRLNFIAKRKGYVCEMRV